MSELPGTRENRVLRSQLAPIAGLILAGVLLAFLWRVLTPHTAHLGDSNEVNAAVDGTLALLGALFGALTAGLVLLRPGRQPAIRALVAIAGSGLAGAISWKLGDQLGTPALRSVAAAFVWPVATSLVLFLGALLPGTSGRLNPPPPETPADGAGVQPQVSPYGRSEPFGQR